MPKRRIQSLFIIHHVTCCAVSIVPLKIGSVCLSKEAAFSSLADNNYRVKEIVLQLCSAIQVRKRGSFSKCNVR